MKTDNGEQIKRYNVTVKGHVYPCLSIKSVATIVKFVAPRPCIIVCLDNDGKNILMDDEDCKIIEQACLESN